MIEKHEFQPTFDDHQLTEARRGDTEFCRLARTRRLRRLASAAAARFSSLSGLPKQLIGVLDSDALKAVLD